ncbi:hypothetical protein ONZ45_g8621 [Pleurotus djamor]|nr:hypothetical protein ONZ45_g16861 [Pleurotus djamor]KAJ8509180.1 hypothetical protein ONZ45_g8621 [Pleurotus djamor]
MKLRCSLGFNLVTYAIHLRGASLTMLSLSTLYAALNQVLSPPSLHTAILFTVSGQLISYASNLGSASSHNHGFDSESESNDASVSEPDIPCPRPKDDIRVLVGLGGELWGETKDEDIGMVDCELGRLVVMPIFSLETPEAQRRSKNKDPAKDGGEKNDDESPRQPLMLVALNGTDEVSWNEMRTKAKSIASHFATPLSKYREYLAVAPFPASGATVPPSHVTSPAPAR